MMPWWFWPLYYPFSIAVGGGVGFLFGRLIYALITAFHARVGSKPPFAPFLSTPRQWGLFFGCVLAAWAACMPLLLWAVSD